MAREQQSRWRRTGRQLLWAVGIAAVFTAAVLIGYRYDITLWDWSKLLIVPAVIAGGGLWFNRQQRERELETAREQREREVEIAERRTQDEALQAYLDQMSEMLIPNKDQPSLYKASPGDSLSSVARARTLTVLPRLDGDRKARVVQFLHESGLIAKNNLILALNGADLGETILSGAELRRANLAGTNLTGADLTAANLSGAELRGANLTGADLRGAFIRDANPGAANLSEANLAGINLTGVDLTAANLSGADLSKAELEQAELFLSNLSGANLSGARLFGADLRAANLIGAKLEGAELSFLPTHKRIKEEILGDVDWLRDAKLDRADLSRANLIDAKVTPEQLMQAKSLEDATMPNGQKYEDWIKDRESAQDEALQSYLDQMSGLLLERDLRASEEYSEVRTLARARTLTVLSRFDPSGKTAVMQFLEEATLVQRVDGREPIINLSGADLSGASLSRASLSGAYLSDAYLGDANLRGANLSHADLSGADLNGADLNGADLRLASLFDASLSDAYLRDAYLGDANLRGANLSGAYGITNEKLAQQAKSLKDATMPNGQKYEDWLKSKGDE